MRDKMNKNLRKGGGEEKGKEKKGNEKGKEGEKVKEE